MLTSPITITYDAVAKPSPRINQDNFGSVYRYKDGTAEFTTSIRHSYEGKVGPNQVERHNVDLQMTTWDVNGNPIVRQAYVIFRNPRNQDPVGAVKLVKALNDFVSANNTALGNWES